MRLKERGHLERGLTWNNLQGRWLYSSNFFRELMLDSSDSSCGSKWLDLTFSTIASEKLWSKLTCWITSVTCFTCVGIKIFSKFFFPPGEPKLSLTLYVPSSSSIEPLSSTSESKHDDLFDSTISWIWLRKGIFASSTIFILKEIPLIQALIYSKTLFGCLVLIKRHATSIFTLAPVLSFMHTNSSVSETNASKNLGFYAWHGMS